LTAIAQQRQVRQAALPGQHRLEREDGVLPRRRVRALKPLGPAFAAGQSLSQVGHRVAFERRRQHVDDRRQRIGPFIGREPHHAEHDDHADQRRSGRAEPGVHEVHVVEQSTDGGDERRVVLGLEAVDDVGIEGAASSWVKTGRLAAQVCSSVRTSPSSASAAAQ
jgi:hypothetical protein